MIENFHYFMESKSIQNTTDHIYIDKISSFKVYASQKVWCKASLSRSPYQCNVEFDLVLLKGVIQVKYNNYH